MAKERIGKCNACGDPGVEIFGGWDTLSNKRCLKCESKRRTDTQINKARERLKEKPSFVYKPVYKEVSPALAQRRKTDKELNEEIWATRPHVCDNCEKRLPATPVKANFSHLLTKGSHPELRHDPENIVLSCIPCHNLWEFGKNRETMATYQKHIAYMVSKGFVPKDL